MSLYPKPGQIYRHKKHDPSNGEWHEYEVICLVEAGSNGDENSPRYFTSEHTEIGQWYDILPALDGSNKSWAWPAVQKPHVCYSNTQDNSGKTYLRPLEMFMDGRFKLVETDPQKISAADAKLYLEMEEEKQELYEQLAKH